jgi:hypothetical protein
MVPSHERLGPQVPLLFEGDDRLELEEELLVVERAAKVCLESNPPLCLWIAVRGVDTRSRLGLCP